MRTYFFHQQIYLMIQKLLKDVKCSSFPIRSLQENKSRTFNEP